MSTYRNIHGRSIRAVTTDPTADVTEGEIWYNTASDTFKTVLVGEAWSAGASTANAKQRPGGCGTQTAGLACGGLTAPPASALATTEEYNGVGWASGGNVNTARGNTTAFGTQTAAVYSGKGSPSTPYAGTTELYNGTAWTTNPNAANDTYNYRSACGISTAGLLAGGNYPPTNRAAGVEEFDGTSFSEGGDLPQKQSSQGQAGTQTAAINSFGYTNSPVPGNSGDAENTISLEYNGTSWTAGPNGNGVVPLSGYAMGSGTQTDALFAGGPPTNSCKYDGTTFTVGPALATAQPASARGSTSASATWIAHGSPVPSVGTDTQEFNKSANIITAAAWSSAPAVGTGRYLVGGAGATYNASVIFGGVTNPGSTYRAQTEEYDGTSWSEDGDMGTARFLPAKSIGTATAALAAGGYNGSTLSNSEQYNGTSWAAETSMPAVNRNQSGFGIETAGVVAGGQGPAIWANVYEYDGSAWTTANALPVAKEQMAGCGVETAGLVVCGRPPSGNVTTVEEFDGTNWASGGAYPTAHAGNIVAGTQTNAYQFTGYDDSPAPFGKTASYDGTSWRTMPSLATNISSSGGSTGQGSGNSQIQGAGSTPGTPSSTTSQEFNVETTALNVKTLTQS